MKVFRLKRYRFFYPAGLISLVLLPLLGYFYLYQREEMQQNYAIELNVYSTDQTKNHPDIFPDPITMRKYTKIYLTGEKRHDSLKLKNAQLSVRQMLSNKDTVNGVQLVYGPKAKYASFIQTLNICLKENVRAYTPYENSFLILYINPTIQPKDLVPICGTQEQQAKIDRYYRDLAEIEHLKRYPRPAKTLPAYIKSFWHSAILYIIMVSLTAQKVVRQFRNRQLPTIN